MIEREDCNAGCYERYHEVFVERVGLAEYG
jgi:hypothetical protein